jgi:hypothetical protein
MPQKNWSREAATPQAPGFLVCYDDSPEITPPALYRQAQWLAARFGLPLSRARLLAGIAFAETGRRS